MRGRRQVSAVVAAVCALGFVPLAGAPAAPAQTAATANPRRPAVIGVRVIGHTVRNRNIYAFHTGQPSADSTVVIAASMHGNELAPQRTVRTLRDGDPIRGVNLWLVPTYNPDGAARHDRQNARGVDLNRNFPRRWKPLTGNYYSGPRPASEPETRAMMRFLDRVDPDYVISFHQPFHGIDPRGAKRPRWTRNLAANLRLPTHHIDCGGVCHGTMTQWFNARHDGFAITAEMGPSPSVRYLTKVAPRGLMRSIGGRRHPESRLSSS